MVVSGLGIISNEIQRTVNGAQLGAIPTDMELATIFQYTPVHSGWIYGRVPVNMPMNGFASPDMPPGTSSDIAAEMLSNQKWQLVISSINMLALTALAYLSIKKILKETKGKIP